MSKTHFTPAEASRAYSVTESSIRNAVQKRRLPVTRDKRTRRILIAKADLEAWLGGSL